MKLLTGGSRFRCLGVTLGGYGRSRTTEVVILELEEQDDDTGDISWRYATYEDLKAHD